MASDRSGGNCEALGPWKMQYPPAGHQPGGGYLINGQTARTLSAAEEVLKILLYFHNYLGYLFSFLLLLLR